MGGEGKVCDKRGKFCFLNNLLTTYYRNIS